MGLLDDVCEVLSFAVFRAAGFICTPWPPASLCCCFKTKYVPVYQRLHLSSSVSTFVRCQGFWTLPAALFSQVAHRTLLQCTYRASRNQLLHRLRKAAQQPLSMKPSACKLPECSLLRLQLYSASHRGVVVRKCGCRPAPLRRMPLVPSQVLCPAWKPPQKAVRDEARECIRRACKLLTFAVFSAAGRSITTQRAAFRFCALICKTPSICL